MSLFAEGEPRRNHKTFAVYRSRRRFRRSLRSLRNGGSPVTTRVETRAASDSLRQRQALPAAHVSLFHPLHGAPFRRRRQEPTESPPRKGWVLR